MLILLVTGCACISEALEFGSMPLVLPTAKCELNITLAEQGLISSISFLGQVLTAQIWAILIDKWGRIKSLRLSVSMYLIFSILSSFSVNSIMLLVCRFLNGLW